MVIEPQFRHAQKFSEGLARVNLGGNSFCIDKTGKKAFDLFGFMGEFSEGLAPARLKFGHQAWGYIDKKGKIAIDAQFDKAESFKGGLARVTIRSKYWEEIF